MSAAGRQLRFSVLLLLAGFAAAMPWRSGLAQEEETVQVTADVLNLNVPKAWKQEPPSNNLRLTQFVIPPAEGDSAAGELVVSGPFGGSHAQNIKRWVDTFEPDGRQLKMTTGTGAQGTYVIVELSGTHKLPDGPPILGKTRPAPGYRMLGVILTIEKKGNYFLKFVGPDRTVAANAKALRTAIGGSAEAEKPYELTD